MKEPIDIPLLVLPELYAVCRLAPDLPFPDWARSADLISFVRTPEELSVVCKQRYVPPDIKAELGWRVIKVQGPLDFDLVSLLASITAPLANAGISIFVISSFETDYVLVKEKSLDLAVEALTSVGFLVLNYVDLSS